MNLPIACSLDAGGAERRRREWEDLVSEALRSHAPTATGVRLAFSATDDVDRRLGELVELERQCCAFARWTVTSESEELVLRVDGEGDAVTAIQALFQA